MVVFVTRIGNLEIVGLFATTIGGLEIVGLLRNYDWRLGNC